MTARYHLNENQTILTVNTSWDIPLNTRNDVLTESQYTALKFYCNRFISPYINEHDLNIPIVITSGSIYRLNSSNSAESGIIQDRVYFDAGTGKLCTRSEILKNIDIGNNEIRLKVTGST